MFPKMSRMGIVGSHRRKAIDRVPIPVTFGLARATFRSTPVGDLVPVPRSRTVETWNESATQGTGGPIVHSYGPSLLPINAG